MGSDSAHLGNETHVQHAVGFIDHQQLHQTQIKLVVLHEIHQSARGRHHDVHRLFVQRLFLFGVILTAHQDHGMAILMASEFPGIVGNLDRQLPGRGNHQGSWLREEGFFLGRVVQQLIEQGDQKGCGLAGAGLGLAGNVMAFEGIFQALGLNRSAELKTQIIDSSAQRRMELEFVERNRCWFGISVHGGFSVLTQRRTR